MNFFNLSRKSPVQKEWDALCKRERSLLEQRQKKKESTLNRLLAERVPESVVCIYYINVHRNFHLYVL